MWFDPSAPWNFLHKDEKILSKQAPSKFHRIDIAAEVLPSLVAILSLEIRRNHFPTSKRGLLQLLLPLAFSSIIVIYWTYQVLLFNLKLHEPQDKLSGYREHCYRIFLRVALHSWKRLPLLFSNEWHEWMKQTQAIFQANPKSISYICCFSLSILLRTDLFHSIRSL